MAAWLGPNPCHFTVSFIFVRCHRTLLFVDVDPTAVVLFFVAVLCLSVPIVVVLHSVVVLLQRNIFGVHE